MEAKIKVLTSLIAIFLTTPSVLLAHPHPTDTDGNPLQTNTTYFITTPNGGGLALSLRYSSRHPCPANVAQKIDRSSHGLPLRIFPADRKQLNVALGADLNLAFLGATICVQPTVWRLGDADWRTGHRYVRSAGVVGRPGPDTVRNWFKVERVGDGGGGYKVVYCPGVCGACRVVCGDVGVLVENGVRWLGLGGQPLVIGFRKSNSTFGSGLRND